MSHIIYDTSQYKEGWPFVHVRSMHRVPGPLPFTYGVWMRARVLIWRDEAGALYVTIATTVSTRLALWPAHRGPLYRGLVSL